MIGDLYRTRPTSAAEARERARAHPELNIFISLTNEEGDGPLVAVKDLVRVRGTITTAGASFLPKVEDREDAPLIAAMRRRGCVIVGKANLHEFAYGATSINSHYGTVANPRAPGRIAGGSSGGSAAAVAAWMCDWAIGSDTGGSIRCPAAMCGVVGFKPTVGTIATEGVIPLSKTLDTIGPLARDVATAAAAVGMMTDTNVAIDAPVRSVRDFKLAVPPRSWLRPLDDDTQSVWSRVSAGVPEIELPDRMRLTQAANTILFFEAFEEHKPMIEQYGSSYDKDVLASLERGRSISREQYERALVEQAALRNEMESAMAGVDALLVPGAAIVAPPSPTNSLEARELLTVFTRPFNTTGQPAFCLPYPTEGLPVGIQVVGHFGKDAHLIEVARALEAEWG